MIKKFLNCLFFSLKKNKKIKTKENVFEGSAQYWGTRYSVGKNSGSGSYGRLAKFKAQVINKFVTEMDIKEVIEYGSGDGNQLKLSNYKSYIGFDVSLTSITLCKKNFKNDNSKKFYLLNQYNNQKAELTLSLDVIFHLIEDDIFHEYMNQLFSSSESFVIIYSSNTENNPKGTNSHVRHRKFTNWITKNKPEWEEIKFIKNSYKRETNKGNTESESFCNFHIYGLK